MLRRLINRAEIETGNDYLELELEIDLRRMDKLRHENMPETADAYLVKVTPSSQTYTPHLHRFIFEIQYGTMEDELFIPVGKPVRYQSETLPMI